MAGHELIEGYLAELARRLPPDVVEELADGLDETVRHHLDRGLSPAEAAAAATTEFGDPARIAAEFARQSPGRRAALTLLATGPVLAALWAPSLITAQAWTWAIPTGAIVAFAAAMLITVAALLAIATSHNHSRTRLATLACAAIIALDAALITAVTFLALSMIWPITLAVAASVTRITISTHHLRHVLTS